MAKAKPPEGGRRRSRPPTTPEEQEAELVSLAYEVAEEQLRNRTASSQVITQLLKYGSAREVLEREKIQHENALAQVRMDAIESQTKMEDLYAEAIKSMSRYRGEAAPPSEDDEE
jgi:phage-related baseplate assembly protein